MGGQIVSKTSSDGSLKYVGPHEFTNAGNDNFFYIHILFIGRLLIQYFAVDAIICVY